MAKQSDDAGLLSELFGSQRSEGAVVAQCAGESVSAKRQCLRRADYVGSQIFQPHGPSPIEKAELGDLWDVVRQGNKWTEFYSYLAHPESARQGVAISQCAQTLKHAISHFKESRVHLILKDSVYTKVQESIDSISPHLEVLDGGYNYQGRGGGFARLGRTITVKSDEDVAKSSKALYEWLSKPQDAFRAYLQIMSGAGVVYAAQCEEKVLRAYVVVGKASVADFTSAAKARLCTEEGRAIVAVEKDDWALTQP